MVLQPLVGDGFREGRVTYFWPMRREGKSAGELLGKYSLSFKKAPKEEKSPFFHNQDLVLCEQDAWNCSK